MTFPGSNRYNTEVPYAGWDGWRGSWSKTIEGDWGIQVHGSMGDKGPKSGDRVLVIRKNGTCSVETLGEKLSYVHNMYYRTATWKFLPEIVEDEQWCYDEDYYGFDVPH